MMAPFRIIQKEDELKASKFLKQQFFVPTENIKKFFSRWPDLLYIPIGKVFSRLEPLPSIASFFSAMEAYEKAIFEDDRAAIQKLRVDLSGAFSLDQAALGCVVLPNDRCIFKLTKPLIQFQLFSFIIGIEDKIHFTLGKTAFYLGFQSLYPQLYIDSNHQVCNGLKDGSLNLMFYQAFVQFLREETSLLRFEKEGKEIKTTIRIEPRLLARLQQAKGPLKALNPHE